MHTICPTRVAIDMLNSEVREAAVARPGAGNGAPAADPADEAISSGPDEG